MTVSIADGWITGSLPGPAGDIRVSHYSRGPGKTLSRKPPLLVIHTTEGGVTLGDRYKSWEFPPNFACGDYRIVQLFPLGRASYALKYHDEDTLQIETAWNADADVYLPPKSTLYPLVALVAFLHTRELIATGLQRPNQSWPLRIDRGPQASSSYYRRNDGTWPKAGVYGHIEIPGDDHWDPGSFDYPKFFQMVADVTNPAPSDEMGFAEFKEGWRKHRAGDPKPGDAGDPDVIFGWNARDEATSQPVPGTPGPHAHNLDLPAVMTRTDVA